MFATNPEKKPRALKARPLIAHRVAFNFDAMVKLVFMRQYLQTISPSDRI